MNWIGWATALGSVAAFSVAPPISKAAIGLGLDPTMLLVARFLVTLLLLGGTILLTGADRLRVDRRGLLVCGAAGLVNGLGMLAFFWALPRIEASVASMLFSLTPLATLGLLALRGERFTYRNTIRVALGLAGVYLLIGPGGRVDWIGALLVLVAIWGSAIQLVLLQWFLRDYDSRTITFYVSATMMLVILGIWFTQGAAWHDPGWRGWLAIVALAVVSTYCSRLLMVAAIRYIGSGQMALLTPVETLLTVIWSLLFLHERLAALQWAGGALILSSALLAVKRLMRARPPISPSFPAAST